jgi:hypothetical protein
VQSRRERSPEEANLFNPAFCGALVVKAVENFTKNAGDGLPFSLAFLILPIVLHRETRQSLPRTTITSLLAWIEDHQHQLVGFPDRVRRLRPITQEAVMFGLAHEALRVSESGLIILGSTRVVTTERTMILFTEEARDCIDRSGFVGRWFAKAGSPSTIMAIWGVAP